MGAGIDSYYEYVLKAYILLGDDNYLDRFNKVSSLGELLLQISFTTDKESCIGEEWIRDPTRYVTFAFSHVVSDFIGTDKSSETEECSTKHQVSSWSVCFHFRWTFTLEPTPSD